MRGNRVHLPAIGSLQGEGSTLRLSFLGPWDHGSDLCLLEESDLLYTSVLDHLTSRPSEINVSL